MNRFTLDTHPNYSVKEPKILYIDRYGKIYPDCKTYKTPPICHITDKDAAIRARDFVFGQGVDGVFNMITLEVTHTSQPVTAIRVHI